MYLVKYESSFGMRHYMSSKRLPSAEKIHCVRTIFKMEQSHAIPLDLRSLFFNICTEKRPFYHDIKYWKSTIFELKFQTFMRKKEMSVGVNNLELVYLMH